jgi:hypothetical protein
MNTNLGSRLLRHLPAALGTILLATASQATAQCTTTSPNAYWESFGTGCGTPPILTPLTNPIIGTTLNLLISAQPATTLLTFTRFSWNLSVPTTGDPTGLPLGCLAFIGPGPSMLGFPVAGNTSHQLAIPNNPSLTGLVFHAQSAAFTNATPWAELTNAVCLHIGT